MPEVNKFELAEGYGNERIFPQYVLEDLEFVDCCGNFPLLYMPRQYGRHLVQYQINGFLSLLLKLYPEAVFERYTFERYTFERYLEETKYGPILDPPKITEKFTYNKPMNLSYPEYKMYSEDENGIDGKPSASRKRRSKLVQK